MATLFQVGAGSGGMVVLDLMARDPRIERIILVEPDVYESHNVERHYFPMSAVGRTKADLAAQWLKELRPAMEVTTMICDLMDPTHQEAIRRAIQQAHLGVCAVDNEPAKYHFDALLRGVGKPWTLGEVLSGGIGGWVHRLVPGGPCYGCIASHLQRSIVTDNAPPPNYAAPNAAVRETRIPASKASIHTIAGLHALTTLGLLEPSDPGFSSLLWTMTKVDGVFPEAFRAYRFRIARASDCLICGTAQSGAPSGEELDVALDEALARLGRE